MALASLADRLPPWAQDRLAGSGARTALVALVAVAVLAVGGVELMRAHGGSSPYPAAAAPAYPVTAGATPTALAGAPDQGSGSIVVDVSGRVRKPGLVTLPSGARVADAIGAAGGPTRPRDIRTVDLAAKVGDGQLLLVGESGTASAATGSTTGSTTAGPVDLSSATLDQLETIPGVGPVTAQKIIDFRSAHNGFSSVSQLQQVPGIGPAKYAEISPLVIS
jgi:competence protein ComEA